MKISTLRRGISLSALMLATYTIDSFFIREFKLPELLVIPVIGIISCICGAIVVTED